MRNSKEILAILIIFIFSLAVGLNLFKPGLFAMHDDTQVARTYLFDQSLRTGQFPVRWIDELGFGFGYPLFIFYPPLVYAVGDIFHSLGFSFIDSVKLVFFSSIFLSGVAMYFLIKDMWGKLPALVSALFYMLVPYRALDVYVRGAMAESFSFVWLPLILWSFYKLSDQGKKYYIYLTGIFLALLMITHNLTFMAFSLVLIIYLLFLLYLARDRKNFALNVLFSTALGLCLSAFFWIPALAEKKFTLVDRIFLATDYRDHFVYPIQLWNWPWGFGGSAPGLADGISFKIGKLHIIVALVATILAIIHLAINKIRPKLSIVTYRQITNHYQLSIVFFLLFLFSAFMTTFYSKFIWEAIKPLAYLQFPWRFLTFTALFTSILAGALVYFLRLTIIRLTLSILLITVLVIPNLKLFKAQSYRTNLTDKLATAPDVISWDVSLASFEFAPKGIALYKNELGTQLLKVGKDQIRNDKVEVLQGSARISDLKTDPSRITFKVASDDTSNIGANLFNFPGWVVLIDGIKTSINDSNPLKLISFKTPAGTHNVDIKFSNTPVRNVANLISLFSLIYLIFQLSNSWITRTKN